MAKKKNKSNSVRCFSFGDPETVLASNLQSYLGVFFTGEYYQPPVNLTGLSKIQHASTHHGSCLHFKANMMVKWLEYSPILSRETARRLAYDYLLYGMMYPKYVKRRDRLVSRIEHCLTLHTRRMKEKDRFLFLTDGGKQIKFNPGEVQQIMSYDGRQTLYGVPEYFAGVQSVLLNEDATLFRRKYYKNGAHMGYVFLTTDKSLSPKDQTTLENTISKSKGVGNFQSMYLHMPGAATAFGGKDAKKPVEIIPVGDISHKDEFEQIKNISRGEALAMHRVHPALAAVMPDNVGGFGDLNTISQINYENEVVPLQQVFLQINDFLPRRQHISFREPDWKKEQEKEQVT